MKNFFTLFVFCLGCLSMQAQITVDRQDYTLQIDSVVKGWRISTAGLDLPEEGADVTWDFSGQAILGQSNYVKTPANNPLFPQANVTDISLLPGLNGLAQVPTTFFEVLDDDGYRVIGRLTEEVKVPSGPLTGSPGDTITFVETTNTYQEPNYYVRFPLNYNDTWISNIELTTNYEITVAAFGLNQTPASQVTTTERTDTVTGWGTLILPHPDGTGSVEMEVLMLRINRIQETNFFLAGMPAPQVMLDALGLTQGEIITSTDYSFFAKGFPRTVLSINTDGQGNYESASISDDIRNITSSTYNQRPELVVTLVAPNPSRGDFNLQFTKTDTQPWTLDVFNALGQNTLRQTITEFDGQVNTPIRLESDSKGMHHYILRNAAGAVVGSGNLLIL